MSIQILRWFLGLTEPRVRVQKIGEVFRVEWLLTNWTILVLLIGHLPAIPRGTQNKKRAGTLSARLARQNEISRSILGIRNLGAAGALPRQRLGVERAVRRPAGCATLYQFGAKFGFEQTGSFFTGQPRFSQRRT